MGGEGIAEDRGEGDVPGEGTGVVFAVRWRLPGGPVRRQAARSATS